MVDNLTGLFVALLVALLLFLFVLLFSVRSRVFRNRSSLKNAYNYDFTGDNVQIHSVNLVGTKMEVPSSARGGVVLVELTVRPRLLGYLFLPCIRILGANNVGVQYFELGASGKRYLNVTHQLSKGEKYLCFNTRHLDIIGGRVRIIVYSSRDIIGKNVLVISPHPDDAEIAAFGVYAAAKSAWVITVTAGESGGNIFPSGLYGDRGWPLKKGILRSWNSVTVPLLGGVEPQRSINLGYFDGTLRKMYLNRGAPVPSWMENVHEADDFLAFNYQKTFVTTGRQNTWFNLVEDLKRIISSAKPDVIITPYSAIDASMDHKFATVAVIEALHEVGISSDLLLYTNHLPVDERYPLGPTGSLVTLPPTHDSSLYFDSIYSFNLSEDVQSDKLMALDAMNDLRCNIHLMSIFDILDYLQKKIVSCFTRDDASYFRRAVRANELFYVISAESLEKKSVLYQLFGENVWKDLCEIRRADSR